MSKQCSLDQYMDIYNGSKSLLSYLSTSKSNRISTTPSANDFRHYLNKAQDSIERVECVLSQDLNFRERRIVNSKYLENEDILMNKEVASNLKVSEATVQRNIREIKKKFDSREDVFTILKNNISELEKVYFQPNIRYVEK